MAPVTLLKTGSASLEASWRRLACAGDKRARACTSKRRGESALPRIRRGFWIEADPRHVKEVIKALGLEGASPVPAPGVAAKGETRSKRTRAASTPTWRTRRPPCSARSRRGVPIPARHCVRHYEAVLKDVSAGRTRLEEHEERVSVLRWKATGWVSI